MKTRIRIWITFILILGAALASAQEQNLSSGALQVIINLVDQGLISPDIKISLEKDQLTVGQLRELVTIIEEKLAQAFVQDPAELEALGQLVNQLKPQFKQASITVGTLEERLAQLNRRFAEKEKEARLSGTNYVTIRDYNAWGPFKYSGGSLQDISGGYWGANDTTRYVQSTYLFLSQRLDAATTLSAGLSIASDWNNQTLRIGPHWRGSLTHTGIKNIQLTVGHFWQGRLSGLTFANSNTDFFAAGYTQEMNGLRLSGKVGANSNFQFFASRQTGTPAGPEAITLEPYQVGGQLTTKLLGLNLNLNLFGAFDGISGRGQLDHNAISLELRTQRPLFGYISVISELGKNSFLYWPDSTPDPSADPKSGTGWVTKLSTGLLGQPLNFIYSYLDPGFSYYRNAAYLLYPDRDQVTGRTGTERYAKLEGPGQAGWCLDWQLAMPSFYRGALDLSQMKLQVGNVRDLTLEEKLIWGQADLRIKYLLGKNGSALTYRRLLHQRQGKERKGLEGIEGTIIWPGQLFSFQGSISQGNMENMISWEYPKDTWLDRKQFDVDGIVTDLAVTYSLYPETKLSLGLINHKPGNQEWERETRFVKVSSYALDQITIWLRFQELNYLNFADETLSGRSKMLDLYLAHSF